MILSILIQKNGLRQLATLTPATPATVNTLKVEAVAKVATVAVANPEAEQPSMIDALDSQLIMPNPEPLLDEKWLKDDRRHCFMCANLTAGRCLAAWRGEIEAARHYRPIDDIPRRCEGYAPKSIDPDQRLGKQRWPGLTRARQGAAQDG
jgi:hypothetical protein